MKIDLAEIQQLREEGLTYQAIGDRMGVSRQGIYQRLHPDKFKAYQKTDKFKAYQKAYRKTDKFKAYRKHSYHTKINKVFSNCERCV